MKIIIYLAFGGLSACASVKEQEKPHHDWSISITDNIVIPGNVVETKLFSFRDNMSLVLNTVTGKFGFVNPKGEIVIPCMYDDVKKFYCGRAAVFEAETGKWGFINRENKLIVPFIYDFVSNFGYDRDGDIGFDGLAYVNIGISENGRTLIITDGKWGLINTDGEVILPVKYGDIARPIENMAYIVDGNRADMFPAGGGGAVAKIGFVNRKGEIVIPTEYDYDYGAYFDVGYVTLKKDGVAFKFNMKGEIVDE